jgi:hypothetical protein
VHFTILNNSVSARRMRLADALRAERLQHSGERRARGSVNNDALPAGYFNCAKQHVAQGPA